MLGSLLRLQLEQSVIKLSLQDRRSYVDHVTCAKDTPITLDCSSEPIGTVAWLQPVQNEREVMFRPKRLHVYDFYKDQKLLNDRLKILPNDGFYSVHDMFEAERVVDTVYHQSHPDRQLLSPVHRAALVKTSAADYETKLIVLRRYNQLLVESRAVAVRQYRMMGIAMYKSASDADGRSNVARAVLSTKHITDAQNQTVRSLADACTLSLEPVGGGSFSREERVRLVNSCVSSSDVSTALGRSTDPARRGRLCALALGVTDWTVHNIADELRRQHVEEAARPEEAVASDEPPQSCHAVLKLLTQARTVLEAVERASEAIDNSDVVLPAKPAGDDTGSDSDGGTLRQWAQHMCQEEDSYCRDGSISAEVVPDSTKNFVTATHPCPLLAAPADAATNSPPEAQLRQLVKTLRSMYNEEHRRFKSVESGASAMSMDKIGTALERLNTRRGPVGAKTQAPARGIPLAKKIALDISCLKRKDRA
jgi:hypothetical protein